MTLTYAFWIRGAYKGKNTTILSGECRTIQITAPTKKEAFDTAKRLRDKYPDLKGRRITRLYK
jgi:hypothetical protein